MHIPKFFQTKKAKILLGVLIFIIALRIALPYIMLYYANKTLANMDGYYGHVNDIDVALYRGAYPASARLSNLPHHPKRAARAGARLFAL